jgi:hypothetical protein
MNNKCQVAVYYFPNYHVDTRNEKVHGQGWTEWRLVKNAKPRFPGHDQPKGDSSPRAQQTDTYENIMV